MFDIFLARDLVSLQEDVDRLKRFLKAEKEVKIEDEQRGGQQENLILELQKAVGTFAGTCSTIQYMTFQVQCILACGPHAGAAYNVE
jgi:hypothetical protein